LAHDQSQPWRRQNEGFHGRRRDAVVVLIELHDQKEIRTGRCRAECQIRAGYSNEMCDTSECRSRGVKL